MNLDLIIYSLRCMHTGVIKYVQCDTLWYGISESVSCTSLSSLDLIPEKLIWSPSGKSKLETRTEILIQKVMVGIYTALKSHAR